MKTAIRSNDKFIDYNGYPNRRNHCSHGDLRRLFFAVSAESVSTPSFAARIFVKIAVNCVFPITTAEPCWRVSADFTLRTLFTALVSNSSALGACFSHWPPTISLSPTSVSAGRPHLSHLPPTIPFSRMKNCKNP